MKRILSIMIICIGALMLTGCTSFAYEHHHYHSRPRVIHGPSIRVIEVVPAPPARHHRPGRYRYHRY